MRYTNFVMWPWSAVRLHHVNPVDENDDDDLSQMSVLDVTSHLGFYNAGYL